MDVILAIIVFVIIIRIVPMIIGGAIGVVLGLLRVFFENLEFDYSGCTPISAFEDFAIHQLSAIYPSKTVAVLLEKSGECHVLDL